jgi:peptidoglycan-N-acetylglucosamine deacetylase
MTLQVFSVVAGIIVALVLCVFIVYSVLPNLWVRVFHRRALRVLPASQHHNHVVLTFDDGPDATYTPRLLDALHQAGVRATFFVIAAKANHNPSIIKRMLEEGHDVQIHGYRHLMVPFLPPRATRLQIEGSSQLLKQKFGIESSWYRPTWGLCNAVTLFGKSVRRYRLVTWSIMVGDWKQTTPQTLLQRIDKKLHPGAVIVLHDSDETFGADKAAPENVIALIPHLVRSVHSRGYEFVTLSQAMS